MWRWNTGSAPAASCLATLIGSLHIEGIRTMTDADSCCRLCGDQFEAGDTIARIEVRDVIEDPSPGEQWGTPFEDDLRPVQEGSGRQYAHLGCLDGTRSRTEEPKRTNARVIDPEEIGGDSGG